MQDLLLLVAVAALFAFGWFLMRRLDDFLENSGQAQDWQGEFGEDTLRIGFSDPSVADSIADVLEKYSQLCSDISVCLFHGASSDLIRRLCANELNVIFLPENADIPVDTHYNVREVLLSYTPVMMKYGGLPIEPIADGQTVQDVLWSGETSPSFVLYFIECLKDEFSKPQTQK